MENENKWEYDYSSLYRQNGTTPAADTGYQNVGSSGTNAANQYDQPAQSAQPAQPVQPEQPAQGAAADTGSNGAVPPTGVPPYNNSTAVPPQPPRQPQRPLRPKKNNKEWVGRVATVVLAGVVGFGGGLAGFAYANRGGMGNRVVLQTVERPSAGSMITSTGGKELSRPEVASMVSPSVVVITTEQMVATGNWYGQGRVESGAGSGVIMTEDGYIMTNSHVVAGASYITVTIDDKDYPATLIGDDAESDIAVLKIEANDLVPAVMGDSDTLSVGESVVAVGNPLGELGGTVTEGIISALNRNVLVEDHTMTLVQTSASVSPGNSGGGLFNMQGELIGIVNAKSSSDHAEGLGFAIPINTARQVATDLIENGYVSGRPAMGVRIIDITNQEMAAHYGVPSYGVYIYDVEKGSSAEKAGLRAGDRVLSIDDIEVTSGSTLSDSIKGHNVGDTVTLTIAREGKMLQVELVLGEKSAPSAENPLPEAQKQEG